MKTLLALALVLGVSACASHKEHTVTIAGMKFEPEVLTVGAGDLVTFRNDDIVTHTATSPGRFDSGPIEPHASFRVTITKAGDVSYGCTLHPVMTGKIVAR